jgi:hypothetical protein
MEQTLVSERPLRAGDSFAPPYAPAWLNRFTDWVERLPVPAWVFYLGAWGVLFGAYTGVKWLDGTYSVGTLFLFHAVITGLIVYTTAAAHYLSDVARNAMRTFRPLFKGDESLYRELHYRLTRLPGRWVWAASLVGIVYSVSAVLVLIPGSFWERRRMFTSDTWSVAADYVMSGAMWVMLGVGFYQIIHQLRLVSLIYTRHTTINLFAMGPLYEFSKLTARASLVVIVGLYAWFASDPSPLAANADPNYILVLMSLGSIAMLAFVQPLLGLHGLLVAAKQGLQEENGRQLESAIAQLHSRVSTGELGEVEKLESAMNGLIAEREVLEKLRTWPWEPDTARVVITATLLPLVLWVIQRVLDQFAF